MSNVTIVGGGIGGYTVAAELRNRGFEGAVTIIDPLGYPYDRPPLSKEILQGSKNAEQLLLAPRSWYEENKVTLVKAKVDRIKPEERELVLDGGGTHSFDKLVLATGGLPRPLPAPGFDDPDLFVLRTTEDAQRLKKALGKGTRLAIIGAGLIGAEVASSARELGAEVTLIDPVPVALVPAVGKEIAERLHALHAAHGVETVAGFTTGIRREGATFVIDIDGKDTVTADVVLVAVGIIPEENLAKSAELECDGGVLVDHAQRTTADGIWAVGDCARVRNADGTLERRHEHWESAIFDAQTAAADICGQELPEHGASWFWTDRYGVHVEGVGSMTAEGETVIRPDEEGQPQVVFRVAPDSTIVGCTAYDKGMAVRAARRLIDRKVVVDPEALADPAVNLKKLAR
ncbi:FAD-dependent oxidoreductase [Corynebacterium hindlerae]|uniref:FAD-dependent oxidoreductase n=1 Tax=Corynebacterium hindlerae TaxID=699041 RepID=A0A7G5FGK2_9CORY|nr:FAD-dependent oxidoreductase [Corynebacterium hindlerae]QMV85743.1 FAD-dependent oxidoreductase [Corynebacterium hindlerae]